MKLSKKYFLMGIFIGLTLLIAYLISFPDGKLHLIFCDVGQGDAAYIKAPNGMDMLIDGGPNDKVLSCLGKYMPFYDRSIDLVVLTHPQKDHLLGLISVLERFTVKYFVLGIEGNSAVEYQKFVSLLKEKNIPIKNLYAGDEFELGEIKFKVFWPKKEWVAENVPDFRTNILGLSTSTDLNFFSYNLLLQYRDFEVLFTGDADSVVQPEIAKTMDLPDVDLIKVPHHGSKTGLLPEFLDKLKPEMAVISVGKNMYGHPSEQTLSLLQSRNILVRRTDREGNIEIVTNGRGK